MQKSFKYAATAAFFASLALPAMAAQQAAQDNAGQQNTPAHATGQQTASEPNNGAENNSQANAARQGAESQTTAQNTTQQNPAQQKAYRDFGKLSADGGNALRDIRLTRLDIFDGHINRAKADIAKAISSLDKSKNDETVFTKAEADLKPPAGMSNGNQASQTPSTTPIQWLPVNGAMTLGEDYVATPENSANLAKANAKLAQGDRQGAMNDLKLAGMDVNFLVELAPLQATISGVQEASQDLDQGKYYEANQALKSVEDGMRFDSESLIAAPQNQSADHGNKPNG